MEFLMQHWLSVAAGIFLLAMVLYGHYRGFLRIALTMSALIISIFVVRVTIPYATNYLKANTSITQALGETLRSAVGADEDEEDVESSGRQRMMIENLKLPPQVKEVLLENNNSEMYSLLGVESFLEYIGTCLADMLLKAIGSVILFVIVYFLLRQLIRWLDLVTCLPIICGINQIAGAIIGAVQGLLWLWAAGLLVSFCEGMAWTAPVLAQISGSAWLSFLYHNNLINWIFIGLLYSMI